MDEGADRDREKVVFETQVQPMTDSSPELVSGITASKELPSR